MSNRKYDVRDKIIKRPDYKHILKAIKANMADLDNRQLVDTLFSVGKLHKHPIPPEIAEESRLFPFFNHLVGDFLEQATSRVTELGPQEIAYFLKGVTHLHKVVGSEPDLVEKEQKFREQLLAHLNTDHEKVRAFDPYVISKVLRYLLRYNDGGAEA